MSEDVHVSGRSHIGSLEHSCEVCELTPAPCVHLGVKGMVGVLCTGEKADQVSPDFQFVTCQACRKLTSAIASTWLNDFARRVKEELDEKVPVAV
jgi:hypothetical protein